MQSNPFSVQDLVIIVTGATGALAGTAARHLLGEGAHVVFLSRNQERIDHAVAESRTLSGSVSGFACSVTDRSGLEETRSRILEAHGRIDGLVNGTGGNMPGAAIGPDKSLFDLDPEGYDRGSASSIRSGGRSLG